ncbi:N-acetylmuramoyl-L-alanine amidase [Aristophania vespae]|uniref:N-acetylmuramoyl-L-alanine amidase n=1 Tax=Aristophania vespae TaxID=2697033 RepID=A0A6P1NCV2_9PROT|nr:N-acetylmuramoyl-L-alanine amidase [Aristophania vespae]QHI95279.1 N-acetylmuramoyl-L-alanine amidase [Aristophania vespae]UMM64533.1 hypothetical protein DM15PD_15490 [Aristophania vespae]
MLTRRFLVSFLTGGLFLPQTLWARVRKARRIKHRKVVKSHHVAHPVKAKKILHAPAVHRNAPPPKPVIMLDPGHGGKDPGAIGVSGAYEKHIAQAAAHSLHNLLQGSGRYNVVMTRSEDKFIPLQGRVELAHKHRAKLFISMHADALLNRNVRGASVYTLSSGASDRQTAFLAQRENSADRFASASFHGLSPEVQQILASLVHEETRRGSAHMAASVVKSFRNRINLLTHPARHAGFMVLKSADIPSVLVEMGFMSNRLDEAALKQAKHRQQVALAMKHAVDAYFASQKHPLG